jgi:hypothetical protein
MGAPAVLAGIAIVGGIANLLGKYRANAEEAKARRLNAHMINEEADYLLKSLGREETILQNEGQQVINATEASAAARGVSLSGSALDNLAATAFKTSSELNDLRMDVRRRASIMRMKAKYDMETADRVGGFGTGALDTISTVASTTTALASMGTFSNLGAGGTGDSKANEEALAAMFERS